VGKEEQGGCERVEEFQKGMTAHQHDMEDMKIILRHETRMDGSRVATYSCAVCGVILSPDKLFESDEDTLVREVKDA
jgi:hypothetical protein